MEHSYLQFQVELGLKLLVSKFLVILFQTPESEINTWKENCDRTNERVLFDLGEKSMSETSVPCQIAFLWGQLVIKTVVGLLYVSLAGNQFLKRVIKSSPSVLAWGEITQKRLGNVDFESTFWIVHLPSHYRGHIDMEASRHCTAKYYSFWSAEMDPCQTLILCFSMLYLWLHGLVERRCPIFDWD